VLGRIAGGSQEELLEVEQLVAVQGGPVQEYVVGSTGGTAQGCMMFFLQVLG